MMPTPIAEPAGNSYPSSVNAVRSVRPMSGATGFWRRVSWQTASR